LTSCRELDVAVTVEHAGAPMAEQAETVLLEADFQGRVRVRAMATAHSMQRLDA